MSEFDLQAATRDYYRRIHRAALVMTGNPSDADDLAQDTFLEAARSAHRFAGRATAYTWLYAILLNQERRRRRRNRTWWRRLQSLWQSSTPSHGTDAAADRPLQVREWLDGLWRHVGRLPERQRHAMTLRYSESLTYEEIASVLDCPAGTAKSHVHHGLKTLRELLKGTEYELATENDGPEVGDVSRWALIRTR